MTDYIVNFFKGDWLEITGKVVAIVFVAVLFYVCFSYAYKRRLIRAIVLDCVLVAMALLMCLINVANAQFYVYIVVALIVLTNVAFFANDFKHDMFKGTWKRTFRNSSIDGYAPNSDQLHKTADEIVKACLHMSKSDIGALILIGDNIAESIVESGTALDADVTSELLETVFFPKTPLHDGAVIINGNRIVAAGCYLPIVQDKDLPREFGTRHRAALGVSEINPAVTAIVVSEESGIISAMRDGKIKRYLDSDTLHDILVGALHISDSISEEQLWGVNNYEQQ